MLRELLQLLPSLFVSKKTIAQFSTELINKGYQNFNPDAQHLLPDCYFYAGLQIQVKPFSAYSTFLGQELNYWDWLVYDGFGKVLLKTGVADTRDEGVALAQTWVVDFLDGKIVQENK
ncbi:hypothetical protein QUB05_07505 [Microcoleus sp. F10-C6]|uniref:hypothetical protein n=1 Tax=unclassified Microcoleus TaxID=2642155 RepID=UPI002FD62D66